MSNANPTSNSFRETDRLTDLAGLKHDCLAQWRTLNRTQPALIAKGDMPQLVRLLSAKQQLLVRLQEIDRQLEPFRVQDPRTRQWRSTAQRQRCAEILACCKALYAEIVEQEQHGQRQLTRRRGAAAARLDEAHQARRARAAYLAGARRPRGGDLVCEG